MSGPQAPKSFPTTGLTKEEEKGRGGEGGLEAGTFPVTQEHTAAGEAANAAPCRPPPARVGRGARAAGQLPGSVAQPPAGRHGCLS